MKTIKKSIIILCCLFGLYACDSFLDVTPPSEYTDKNFYKTPTDFKTAITGVYAQLQNIFGKGSTGYMNAVIYRGDETRQSANVNRFIDGSTEAVWKDSWTTLWNIIYRCNKILDRIDAVEFPNSKDKENIKGEALAIRGYTYLQLAWCWGGMPIITTELSLAETLKVPRSTQEATYAQAESDLKDAFELLPENWDASNIGRVTKYAAAGVLGRLYMYTHNYEQAEVYLSEVIAKENTLYVVEKNYEDCFDDAKNNSKERVWEVQYLGGNSTNQALGISQQFSSWFIPSSLNIRSDGPLMNGVTFTGASNSVRVSQSLSADGVYEENDKRRAATIVNGLKLGNSNPDYEAYFCKKFLKATANPPAAIDMWSNNLPILRYTDVKLMYAEALNEINYGANITTKILPIINEVRTKHGGLPELTKDDLPNQEAVFEYLVRERFVEFCFEGLRWPDLIRWGKANKSINPQKAMEKHFAIPDEGFDATTGTAMYKMKPHNVLAPIPYSEIVSYNNKSIMWQNDGY
ncbi:RagB/SusD family nutrient uptake outer membrane protein [Dysgonomonas sp. 520]|uniref:RagB/SusD family nutrient uptake outer membrane protein n=1 Tax=Dysgonomonas sp. 520 TaxID=2302931 RepID=UPI0013D2DA48|nr:RagB/SusD family nutrient uptake outer membrane protein [Dysgonomonas sp. 520]NDW08221.1 RagB/SusD family nutrient uptake outer membrane protein [Dysgonomonas sp. 520]